VLPVLAEFSLGGAALTFRAYSTFLVLAAIVALALAARGAVRLGVPGRLALAGFALAILAGLAGARLLDVVLDWGAYAADPGRVTALQFRGFALYGGIAAGLLVAVALARTWRVSAWSLADASVPAVAAGITLMRVGCFLNGCCAGTPTDLPWGITFPPRDPSIDVQILEGTGLFRLSDVSGPVHPTQLYEMGAALVCGLLATLVARRGGRSGLPALTFAATFTIFRAANQLLRVTPTTTSVPELLPVLYLAVGIVLAGILVRRSRLALEPAKRMTASAT
jgi:phosphatidylglycerol---prolipoprotein diacylglyceryl transferase